MNGKYLVFIAVMAAAATLVVATTAITEDSALATKYKEKSQAVSQVNNCGNGKVPFDTVFCQNLASQIQGDENTPSIAASQSIPPLK